MFDSIYRPQQTDDCSGQPVAMVVALGTLLEFDVTFGISVAYLSLVVLIRIAVTLLRPQC